MKKENDKIPNGVPVALTSVDALLPLKAPVNGNCHNSNVKQPY